MGSPEPRSVDWTRAAHRDLGEIQAYLEPRSQKAWRALLSSLFQSIDRLIEFPRLGPAAEIEGPGEIRKLVVEHCVVVYDVEPNRIVVLRIWDSRQDPARFSLTDDETAP